MNKFNAKNNQKIEKIINKNKAKNKNVEHNALFVDGWGTKGIFTSEIFQNMQKEEYEKFNILAGTSIGGILILAYQVLDFDKVNEILIKKLSKIFNTKNITKAWNILTKKSLYNYKVKAKVLKGIFGSLKIKDLPNNKCFFITTTNFLSGKPEIIENVTGKWRECFLWEAVMYTSDAPFYFNNKKSPYIDGGIYANDPREIYNILVSNNEINDDIKRFLSIGLSGKFGLIKSKKISTTKKIARLLDLLINIDEKTNSEWFDKMPNNDSEKHLRINLSTDKKISINSLTPDILSFFKKEAKRNKDKIKKFMK